MSAGELEGASGLRTGFVMSDLIPAFTLAGPAVLGRLSGSLRENRS